MGARSHRAEVTCSRGPNGPNGPILLACAAVAAILVVDLRAPLGIGAAFLYVPVIWALTLS